MLKNKKRDLLVLAKKAIHAKLYREKIIVDVELKQKYSRAERVFVSVKIDTQLRGCRGSLFPETLWLSVMNLAKKAAFEDPRFIPLTEGEYPDIRIEIAILSEIKEITGPKAGIPKKIRIGTDGLVVELGNKRGVLLPEVFKEAEATPEEALELTCQSAGFKEGTWKHSNCKIYKFTAEIIA